MEQVGNVREKGWGRKLRRGKVGAEVPKGGPQDGKGTRAKKNAEKQRITRLQAVV